MKTSWGEERESHRRWHSITAMPRSYLAAGCKDCSRVNVVTCNEVDVEDGTPKTGFCRRKSRCCVSPWCSTALTTVSKNIQQLKEVSHRFNPIFYGRLSLIPSCIPSSDHVARQKWEGSVNFRDQWLRSVLLFRTSDDCDEDDSALRGDKLGEREKLR